MAVLGQIFADQLITQYLQPYTKMFLQSYKEDIKQISSGSRLTIIIFMHGQHYYLKTLPWLVRANPLQQQRETFSMPKYVIQSKKVKTELDHYFFQSIDLRRLFISLKKIASSVTSPLQMSDICCIIMHLQSFQSDFHMTLK